MKKFRFEYFASCPVGFEEVLCEEIQSFGAKSTKIMRGGVFFEAFHEIALKAILYSRVASRIFKYLYQFDVLNEKDYYLEATDIKWKSLMTKDQTFRLTTIFGDLPREREEFRNSQFANLKLKDAIVDYFRHHDGDRPSVAKDFPDVSILAKIDRGEEKPYSVTIMYDLCGDSLHERGYRFSKTEAPVKENVAAGILKLLKWNPKEENFIDAMCGSGTFVIEAAMMAADIPPTFIKIAQHVKHPDYIHWTFQNYPWLTKDEHLLQNFKNYVQDILDQTEKGLAFLKNHPHLIRGNEISGVVFESAKENLRKAKLDEVVKLTKGDALEVKPTDKKTLFFVNPPYGERLEFAQEERLKTLYKGLGDHWKHEFKTHRAGLFTGNLEMLKVVGLKSAKRHVLFNGDIECRLAEYHLY